jgi:hypothetical protein
MEKRFVSISRLERYRIGCGLLKNQNFFSIPSASITGAEMFIPIERVGKGGKQEKQTEKLLSLSVRNTHSKSELA